MKTQKSEPWMNYTRLNRKKRKLELIRRKNHIRQWPECWHGEFYTNHGIDAPDYSGGWVDFWFYHPDNSHVVVVSMETAIAAAEMLALDETLDNAEYVQGGRLCRTSLMDNEHYYAEREITPRVKAWRKSDAVTRVLVTCVHHKITEKEIHDFIDAYRRNDEFRTRANASKTAKSWEAKLPSIKIAAKRRD